MDELTLGILGCFAAVLGGVTFAAVKSPSAPTTTSKAQGTAYNDGWTHGVRGLNGLDNPYSDGTLEQARWAQGYRAGVAARARDLLMQQNFESLARRPEPDRRQWEAVIVEPGAGSARQMGEFIYDGPSMSDAITEARAYAHDHEGAVLQLAGRDWSGHADRGLQVWSENGAVVSGNDFGISYGGT